jgi:hypothetical protein
MSEIGKPLRKIRIEPERRRPAPVDPARREPARPAVPDPPAPQRKKEPART